MASWKKIITSGSKAVLNEVTASGGIQGTLVTSNQPNITGLGTISSLVATTADINGGTIDNTNYAVSSGKTISGSGTFDVSAGTLTLAAGQVAATKVGAGTFNAGTYSFNGSTISDLGTVTTANIDGGSIDGVTLDNIVATGSYTGSFTGDGSNLTGIVTTLSIAGESGTDTVDLKTQTLTFSGDDDITITAGDTDNQLDIALDAGLTGVTSITNTALKIGRSTTDDYIDFSADDNVYVKIDNTNRLQVTTTGAIVNGLLTTTGEMKPATYLAAGTYVSGSNISGSGHLGIQGGGVINGSIGTYTGADGSTRNIGLHVENDVSASGFKGEFFEITSSILVTSESTVFGNDASDEHIFSGSVTILGSTANLDATNIAGVSASIFSGSFYGDGANLNLANNTTIGSEIFKTITTTTGDDVVADTNSDTLNLSASAGVVVSSSVTEDKIDFSLSNVPNSSLANSTISGKALGTNLGALTNASNGGLNLSLGTYSGSTDITIKQDINNLSVGASAVNMTSSIAYDDSGTTKRTSISESFASMVGQGLTQGTSGHLSASFGSSAGTVAEGNKTLTITGTSNEITIDAGAGANAIGSDTSITLGLADTIGGNRTFSGNVSIEGNTTIGNANSDTVTINADVASNIIPDGNNTRNLGDSSNRFANLYVGTASISENLVVDGNLTVKGTTTQIDVATVRVDDNFILLNSGSDSDSQLDGGLTINKARGTNHESFFWDVSNLRWGLAQTSDEIGAGGTLSPTAGVGAGGVNYLMTVSSSAGPPVDGVTPAYGNSTKRGEMCIDDNDDIWIYVD